MINNNNEKKIDINYFTSSIKIDKIQTKLLGYILEIEYSRVQTTQKHIF